MHNIRTELTKNPKVRPDPNSLGFGKYFTDHMFLLNYKTGEGWYDPRVVPYAPLTLDPSTMVFHYAQESFEGLKAYRGKDGSTYLFRPADNIRRHNASNLRLCIPEIDEALALEGMKELIRTDIDWVPKLPGTSLYIRPFVIATDPFLGVRPSDTYLYAIILSPVGAYYPEGLNPVRIYVETEDVRAVKGGTGYAKAGGNYSATIRAQKRASLQGYTQVLWLDGIERKYIEEVGTMNVFFKIGGEIVTPPLEGSILPGITRYSCIDILKSWGIPVSERRISIDELTAAAESGALEEAFGSGTAAVVSPIGEIIYGDKGYTIGGNRIGELTGKLYDTITGIQWGELPDTFNWRMKI